MQAPIRLQAYMPHQRIYTLFCDILKAVHDCVSISKTSFGSSVGNGVEELLILGSGDFNYIVFQNILALDPVRKRQRKTVR